MPAVSSKFLAARFSFPAASAVAAGTALGVADVLAKVVLADGCDVLTMLLLRSAVGIAFLAGWLRLGVNAQVSARHRWISMANGVLFAGVTFCLFEAIAIIDVPTAILSYFVYPLMTGLGASVFGLEPVRWRGFLSAGVAFCGLAVMIGAHPAGLAFVGVAFALGAACFRTGMLLVTRAFLVGADARATTFYTQLSSMIMFLAVLFATQTWNAPQTPTGWLSLIGVSFGSTAGIFFLFLSTVRIGPFRTALIMNLEPLTVMILSAILLGEVITPIQGVGSAVMLAALVAFQLWQ